MDACKAAKIKRAKRFTPPSGEKKNKKNQMCGNILDFAETTGQQTRYARNATAGQNTQKKTTVLVWHVTEERSIDNYANININIAVNPAASVLLASSVQ